MVCVCVFCVKTHKSFVPTPSPMLGWWKPFSNCTCSPVLQSFSIWNEIVKLASNAFFCCPHFKTPVLHQFNVDLSNRQLRTLLLFIFAYISSRLMSFFVGWMPTPERTIPASIACQQCVSYIESIWNETNHPISVYDWGYFPILRAPAAFINMSTCTAHQQNGRLNVSRHEEEKTDLCSLRTERT